jgi:hypothetical protein
LGVRAMEMHPKEHLDVLTRQLDGLAEVVVKIH